MCCSRRDAPPPPRRHVVLDATHLGAMVTTPDKPVLAHNIVAHELAHVIVMRDRSDREWLDLFDEPSREWQQRALLNLAYGVWDEYATCRLSASIGNHMAVFTNFHHCLAAYLVDYPERCQRTTRKHWHI